MDLNAPRLLFIALNLGGMALGMWKVINYSSLINTILWFGIYWQYFSYNVDNIQFSRNWRWFECDLHVICIENKNVWDVMYASSFVMATLLYYVFNSIWWIIKQYSTCIYLKRELSIFPIKVFSFSIYLAWLKKESDPTLFFVFFIYECLVNFNAVLCNSWTH